MLAVMKEWLVTFFAEFLLLLLCLMPLAGPTFFWHLFDREMKNFVSRTIRSTPQIEPYNLAEKVREYRSVVCPGYRLKASFSLAVGVAAQIFIFFNASEIHRRMF